MHCTILYFTVTQRGDIHLQDDKGGPGDPPPRPQGRRLAAALQAVSAGHGHKKDNIEYRVALCATNKAGTQFKAQLFFGRKWLEPKALLQLPG